MLRFDLCCLARNINDNPLAHISAVASTHLCSRNLIKLLVGNHSQNFWSIGFRMPDNTTATFKEKPTEKRYDKMNSSGREGKSCTMFEDEQLKNPLHTLNLMVQRGMLVDSNTYARLLQGCVNMNTPVKGKIVHTHLIKSGVKTTIFLNNHLVNMYAKLGCVAEARHVFDKMSVLNVFSWNTMISGYIKCGSMDHARQLFDKMPERNVVSWNTIIAGYALHEGEEAFKLFSKMQQECFKPDGFTFSSVISASAYLTAMEQGRQIHSHIIQSGFESHVPVGNALVTMYFKYGNMNDAHHVFYEMPERDEVSWNAVIVGYAQQRRGMETLELFEQMTQVGMKPDKFTLASVLSAFASLEALEKGKQFHAHIIRTGFETNVIVGSALVDMYAKCSNMADAQQVFAQLPERDAVLWNTMISGYSQNEYCEEAVKCFRRMHRQGMNLDECTFVCVLSAYSSLAALEQGKQIHALIVRTGFVSYVSVGNALVTMYAKCGTIENARYMFDKLSKQELVSCNAMIAGYAQHGYGKEAVQLFEQMLQEGIKPSPITFISVLSACSHTGLVDEGRCYFNSMTQEHCITPSMDHYSCIIDLLGRAGRLKEAEDFIKSMPFEPNATGWAALLGACWSHHNIELGNHAAERLFVLEPQNASAYVMLSNMYAAAGRWDNVAKLRKTMKDRGVKKKPGCSWIEVEKRVHVFVVQDRSHPQTEKIYAMLETLAGQMKEAGYVPETNFVLLHEVEE
eukprot:Gb_32983 [translate_table: standard]